MRTEVFSNRKLSLLTPGLLKYHQRIYSIEMKQSQKELFRSSCGEEIRHAAIDHRNVLEQE